LFVLGGTQGQTRTDSKPIGLGLWLTLIHGQQDVGGESRLSASCVSINKSKNAVRLCQNHDAKIAYGFVTTKFL